MESPNAIISSALIPWASSTCRMPVAFVTPRCMTSIHLRPEGANTKSSSSSRVRMYARSMGSSSQYTDAFRMLVVGAGTSWTRTGFGKFLSFSRSKRASSSRR